MQWIHGEPSLDEVLNDPVIRALMRRDGVEVETLRVLIRGVRRLAAPPARGETPARRPEPCDAA